MSQNLDQMISQRLRYLDPWVEERHLDVSEVVIMKGIFGMVKIRERNIWLFFLNAILVDLRGR